MDIMDIAIAKALAGEGGGGGGGGASAFVVTFTPDADWTEATADKTYEEIVQAIESGAVVSAIFVEDEGLFNYMQLVNRNSNSVMFQNIIGYDFITVTVTEEMNGIDAGGYLAP